jgi:hypothetical protein
VRVNSRGRLILFLLLGGSIGLILLLLDLVSSAPMWGARLGLLLTSAALLASAFLLRRSLQPDAPRELEAPRGARKPPDKRTNYREIHWKGLIFRSHSEVRIAKALDHAGLFFVGPGKVRFSAGRERQTRELDFLICDQQGRWGFLEVDGPFHSAEYDAQRDQWAREHGVRLIARFEARRCYDEPQAVIREFLQMLENS